MSTASSILYYLGLNSIEDEVSRLNLASKSPQRDATLGCSPVGEAGGCETAAYDVVENSNGARSRSYPSHDNTFKKTANDDGAAIVDNVTAISTGKNESVIQNFSGTAEVHGEQREETKLNSEASSDDRQHFNLKKENRGGRNCNSCGISGAKACCGGCRTVFYCSEECQARDWMEGNHWEFCQTFQIKKEPTSSETGNRSSTDSAINISVDGAFTNNSSANNAKIVNSNIFVAENNHAQTAQTDRAPSVYPSEKLSSIVNALNGLPPAGMSSSDKSTTPHSLDRISNQALNNINAKRQQILNNIKSNQGVDSTKNSHLEKLQPLPRQQPQAGSQTQQIPSSKLTQNIERSSSLRPVRDEGSMPPRRRSAPTRTFNSNLFALAPFRRTPAETDDENLQILSDRVNSVSQKISTSSSTPPTNTPGHKNSTKKGTNSSISVEANIDQTQFDSNDSLFIFAAAPPSDPTAPRRQHHIHFSTPDTENTSLPETEVPFLEYDVIPLSSFYPGNAIRDLEDGLSENSSTCDIDEDELARRRRSDTNYGKSGLGYYDHDRSRGDSEKGHPENRRENVAFADLLPPVTQNCHTDTEQKKITESSSGEYMTTLASAATVLPEDFMTNSKARNTVLSRAVQEAVEIARAEATVQCERRTDAALADLKRQLEQKYYFERVKAVKEVEQKVRMEVLELYRFRKEPDVSYLKEKQPRVYMGMDSQQFKNTKQRIMESQKGQAIKVESPDEDHLEDNDSAASLPCMSMSARTSDVRPVSSFDDKLSKAEVEAAIKSAVEEATRKLRVELTEKHNAALKEEERKYQRQLAELEIRAAEDELDDAIGLVIGGVKGGLGSTPLKEGGKKCHVISSKIVAATVQSDNDGVSSSGATLKAGPSKGMRSEGVPVPPSIDESLLRKQIETELCKEWEKEKDTLIQMSSGAKEQALKELEGRLTAEFEAALEELRQELKIRRQVIESMEKLKSEMEEENRAAIMKAIHETEDKCKTEALINLNEKLYDSKQNHAKELEELKVNMEKEKSSAVSAMNKKLIDANENINLLNQELQESKAKAADAMKEAVENAIASTKIDHQAEIDRLKKKHEKKLQNFQALTKVDTERAIVIAVQEAVSVERQKNEKNNSDDALKQVESLRTKLAQSEKEREKLRIRLEVAEQWMNERDLLRAEVEKLKKETEAIDLDGLKRQIVEKEVAALELRTERESLQVEVSVLKNKLRDVNVELEKMNQSQHFSITSAELQEPSHIRQGSASSKDTEPSRDYIDSDPYLSEILSTPRLQTIRTPLDVATEPRPLSLLSSFNSEDSSKITQSCQKREKKTKNSEDSSSGIRLLILNVPITDAIEDMVDELGMWLVDNTILGASTATHVIAGDNSTSLRARTPKFMIAISRTSNILHMDWLINSYAEKRVLDCQKYRLINDTAAEKTYNFSMLNSLEEGEKMRDRGGLLNGWNIYICEGVAGNKAPKHEELLLIIKAAGGNILKYSDINSLGKENQAKSIVLTSTPATSEQKKDPKVSRLAKFGKGYFTTSWLFDCIINQKMKGI